MGTKVKHKKRLLISIILGVIFFVFILPELLVLNTIRDLGLLGGKYKIERWSGCTTVFQNCRYGERVTYVSTDSSENILGAYDKKLSEAGWGKTYERYHESSNSVVSSVIGYEKNIFLRKYSVAVGKIEDAKFYPHENNQVSVYVEFYQ